MSADNAIFVMKSGTPEDTTFSVLTTSASWFQELWLDLECFRTPEAQKGEVNPWMDTPNQERLAELIGEARQFKNESEALVYAGELATEVGYAEYGVQIVDVTDQGSPWDKDVADQVLRDAHIEELAGAVVEAAKKMNPGESSIFPNPGYGAHALLICFPLLGSDLYYVDASCEWLPGDGDKPESYKITRHEPEADNN